MKMRAPLIALLLAPLWAAPSGAQEAPVDIQVTGADILRTCREIHRAPQAQDPDVVVTPHGITFNCRLVNANGSTVAQVSPEEVCERLTGSREWYRGAGTQIMCDASGEKTPLVPVPCPQPTDEQILSEDVTRACQKVHGTGNASAEPLRMSVNGPEFNCRLVNSAGFTIAGVSPEQVCEVKTGRKQWCYTETSSYCRGADYVEPVNPNPGPNPVVIPGPKPRQETNPGGEENNTEAPQQEEIEFCKPTRPGGDVPVRIKAVRIPKPGYGFDHTPELVACADGPAMPPEELCQTITGNKQWYLSANGFKEPKGTGPNYAWPNFIAVCRGSGPRERLAFANHQIACEARGWQWALVNFERKPLCGDSNWGNRLLAKDNYPPIAMADVCNEQYGTSAYKTIGSTHWCLP